MNDSNCAVRIPMMSKSLLQEQVAKTIGDLCGTITTHFMRGASFVMIFEKPESAAAAVALTGNDVFKIGSNVIIEYTDARDRGASMSLDKQAKTKPVDDTACTLVFKNLPKDMRPAEFNERILKVLSFDIPSNKITFTRSRHAQGSSRGIAFVNFGDSSMARRVMSMIKDKAGENEEIWQSMVVEYAKTKGGDAEDTSLLSSLRTLAKSPAMCDITLSITSVQMRDSTLSYAAQFGFNVDFESDSIPTKVRVFKPEEPNTKLSADAPVFVPGQPVAERPVPASSGNSFSMYIFEKPKTSPSPSPGKRTSMISGVLPIRQPKGPSDFGFASGRGAADLSVPAPQSIISPQYNSLPPRQKSFSKKQR